MISLTDFSWQTGNPCHTCEKRAGIILLFSHTCLLLSPPAFFSTWHSAGHKDRNHRWFRKQETTWMTTVSHAFPRADLGKKSYLSPGWVLEFCRWRLPEVLSYCWAARKETKTRKPRKQNKNHSRRIRSHCKGTEQEGHATLWGLGVFPSPLHSTESRQRVREDVPHFCEFEQNMWCLFLIFRIDRRNSYKYVYSNCFDQWRKQHVMRMSSLDKRLPSWPCTLLFWFV